MTRADLIMLAPKVVQTLFVFAFGASMGSLINVLVYRIPRGLSVVSPPSRCPACRTRLGWRENIPVFGWLALRGRCRHCGARISAEYPIVEAFLGVLCAFVFVIWYTIEGRGEALGIAWGEVGPEWARNGILATWPAFLAVFLLLGSLTAMTIIDARTYTIPLILAWVPTVAALVLHAGHAAWFHLAHGDLENLAPGLWIATDGTRWRSAEGWLWTLSGPLPRNWGIIGGSIGGVLGILVSLGLQRLGLIRHSFADYETWEREALEKEKRAREAEIERGEAGPVVPSDADGPGGAAPAEQDAAHLWIQYPHARREMVIESAFVGPIVIMAVAGAWLARALSVRLAGPWSFDPQVGGLVPEVDAPLWLTVLGGVCLGYLVGGGVVWAVRILGSLAFGKEAMGIGDVHLMAAVGACLGWVDAVLGFFGAAFVGLGYAILSQIVGGKMKRAMPFGPFLAISTVLVLLFKPAIEIGLARLFGSAGMIDLP